MGIRISEQETTIQFSRDGGTATIWTSDSTVMTRLDKLVKKSRHWILLEEQKLRGSYNVVAKLYQTNKHLVSFRANLATRELTDQQREKMAERMKRINPNIIR